MKRRLPGLVLLFVLLALLLSATVLAEDIKLDADYVNNSQNKNNARGADGVILQTGNTYCLENNLTINEKYLCVEKPLNSTYSEVTLDLNGHTLTIQDPVALKNTLFGVRYYDQAGNPQTEQSPIGILVYSGINGDAQLTLTLTDSSEAKTGELIIAGQNAENAIGIYVGRSCTLNIAGGTITNSAGDQTQYQTSTGVQTVLGTVNMTGGRIENQATGVLLNGGTFSMSDSAEIAGCGYLNADGKPQGGGGVLARVGYTGTGGSSSQQASVLTMSGGTISNCMSAAGGGVCLQEDCQFTMTAGTITGCKTTGGAIGYSPSGGGGVYAGGTFTMSGGTISDCEADNGGGVYVADSFTMSGGTITGCKADASGGGVYVYQYPDSSIRSVLFTMTGGTITNCEAVGANGGGVFVHPDGGFAMSGSASITGCTAKENGGCIFIDRSSAAFTVDDSTITINGQITQCFGGTNDRIDGFGSARFPYQIGSKAELELFGSIVNGTAASSSDTIPAQRDACAILMNDIDLENANWTPIGTDRDNAYTGTFDGKGYTIKNLNIDSDLKYVGLFGYIDVSVISQDPLVSQDGTVRNLTVTGSVKSTGEYRRAGGIVGCIDGGTIENCANLCTVAIAATDSGAAGGGAAGGIVGYAPARNYVTIRDCYNIGRIDGGSMTGGIVGSDSGAEISNCYNVGSVTGNENVGAIAGSFVYAPSNCYYLSDTSSGSARTEKEFADGTVLNLLIHNRAESEHPWAEKCQYVDAAGMTLPVFKNQNTHKHDLTYVPAKAPTTSADGNIEYWYCTICGKYFSDANGDHEITEADTLLARLHYSGGSSPSYPITVSENTAHGTVTVTPKTASAGATVTITATPDSGYVLETVTAVDKQGNELKLTNKGGGKYTFTMPSGKVEVSATFMEDNSLLNVFYDVPNGVYYYDAVKWAVENGITGGVGNSLFAPNRSCTRAEIVTFLWRSAGSPVVNYLMPFTDVEEGAYYAEAVRWAASAGIVNGLTETVFGTDDVCTRAQAAAMIYRYVQAQGGGFTGAWMFLLPFNDTPDWAYESIAWCYQHGITSGTTATTFSPDAPCTRSQIVTFLYRAMQ